MHELPYLEAIVKIALSYATKHSQGIAHIHVTLDESIGFIDDTAEYYWLELIKDFPQISNAKLSIKRMKTPKQCYSCERIFPRLKPDTPCPLCGSYRIGWSRTPICEITSVDLLP